MKVVDGIAKKNREFLILLHSVTRKYLGVVNIYEM